MKLVKTDRDMRCEGVSTHGHGQWVVSAGDELSGLPDDDENGRRVRNDRRE